MNDKILLGFTIDELDFLEWTMGFIEGGFSDPQTEMQRSVTLLRVRTALSDYVESLKSSNQRSSASDKVDLWFSKEELEFLEWGMDFIEGGISAGQAEEQRNQVLFRIKSALSDYKEGIKRSPDGDSFSIECAFCEGTGAFPDILPIEYIPDPCPVCEGRGINIIKTTPDNVLKCRLCGSNGKAVDESGCYSGEVCPACQGKGIILQTLFADSPDEALFWDFIHPEIKKVSKSRYEANHYSDSAEAAFKEINKKVKHIYKESSGEELDGASLMYKAFSPRDPAIFLADISTDSGKNIQNGYMQIFAGAMTGIRNPKAHDNLEIDSDRAVHLLMLASLLMLKLDESTVIK